MHMLATGNALPPGLPARNGDAPTDGENKDKLAIFEAFLGLALASPSPDGAIVTGPEGKGEAGQPVADSAIVPGNPAMPGGNILPVALPDALAVATLNHQPGTPPPAPQRPEPIAAPDRFVRLPRLPNEAALNEPVIPSDTLPASGFGAPAGPVSAQKLAISLTALMQLAGEQPGGGAPAAQPAGAAKGETQPAPQTLAVMQLLGSPSRELPAPRAVAAPAPSDTASADGEALAGTTSAGSAAPVIARPVNPAAQTMPQGEPGADASAQGQPASQPERLPLAEIPASPLPASDAAPALAGPRTSQPSAVAEAPRSAPSNEGHDFSDVVDRLARAREATGGETVRTSIATREFGLVAMQMRTDDGRLHVAMTAADPGFAPAVQAASMASATGQQQQGNADGSAQQQQQGQAGQSSTQGQAAPDGQARQQQQAERVLTGQKAQGSRGSETDEQPAGDTPRGEPGGAIYA
jgi:hypothetical protein